MTTIVSLRPNVEAPEARSVFRLHDLVVGCRLIEVFKNEEKEPRRWLLVALGKGYRWRRHPGASTSSYTAWCRLAAEDNGERITRHVITLIGAARWQLLP